MLFRWQLRLPLPALSFSSCPPAPGGLDSQPRGRLRCKQLSWCSHTPKAQTIKGCCVESLCSIELQQCSVCLKTRCYFSYQSQQMPSGSPIYWEVQGWALFNWLWESYEPARPLIRGVARLLDASVREGQTDSALVLGICEFTFEQT